MMLLHDFLTVECSFMKRNAFFINKQNNVANSKTFTQWPL